MLSVSLRIVIPFSFLLAYLERGFIRLFAYASLQITFRNRRWWGMCFVLMLNDGSVIWYGQGRLWLLNWRWCWWLLYHVADYAPRCACFSYSVSPSILHLHLLCDLFVIDARTVCRMDGVYPMPPIIWEMGFGLFIVDCIDRDSRGAQRTFLYPKPCSSPKPSKASIPIVSVHSLWMNSMMR